MLRYEVLFLTVPEITGDEASNVEKYFSTSVREAKGSMLSFERWGKYRLAYPVQKNDYGVYFLARFEVDLAQRDALLQSVKNGFLFKFNNLVMKNMVGRLDEKASLEYKRLESLEDNPHDVDSFLKKNDMTGLLNKKEKAAAPVQKTEAKEEAPAEKAEATTEAAESVTTEEQE